MTINNSRSYTYKKTNNINSIQKDWVMLTGSSGGGSTIYQSFYVNKLLCKSFLAYTLKYKYKPVFYVVYEDEKPVFIAPLCKYINKREYCSLGNFSGFGVYDFIYNHNQSLAKLQDCYSYFTSLINGPLRIINLTEKSLLKNFISKNSSSSSCIDAVSITFGEDYCAYYKSLTKHMRQNVRTAYNRLNTDNHSYSLVINKKTNVTYKTKKEVLDLYYKRHAIRYGAHDSAFKKWYMRTMDPATRLQFSEEVGFSAILYIDDIIAAFLSGVLSDGEQRVIIPRLSINSNFERYSPGIILLNETIKHCIEMDSIRELDLTRGTESYKLAMGGTLYNLNNYIVDKGETIRKKDEGNE